MTDSRLRILYIARAFPPTIGGMETLAYQLSTRMGAHANVTTIINRRGKMALPAFLPRAFASAFRRVRGGEVDAVHLADALLSPLGAALKAASRVPVTVSVCGLDITYANPAYQSVVPRALRRLDLALPISAATDLAMHTRTGPLPRSRVIPLGVNPLARADDAAVGRFRRAAHLRDDARIVLTVGRLVERKGAAWFAGEILPLLPADTVYVVIGEGPQHDAIVAAAAATGVDRRLRMLGRVDDSTLSAAYRCADVFAMPNVPVAGDMEGFGLVALEAAASGLPVVASRLEGITEAVQDQRNGMLVPPRDADAHAHAINALLAMPRDQLRGLGAAASRFTLETYGWDETARRYVAAIESVVHPRHTRIEARAA
jgi:glycosyltransferase involved in cell wall biosynthesis